MKEEATYFQCSLELIITYLGTTTHPSAEVPLMSAAREAQKSLVIQNRHKEVSYQEFITDTYNFYEGICVVQPGQLKAILIFTLNRVEFKCDLSCEG